MASDPHADIRELSGIAAVRALTADEARTVSEHLAGCDSCRAEYEELRTVADLLLRAPEPIAPSPELRSRILAAVAADPRQEASDSAPAPIPIAARRRRFDWRNLALAASFAAAVFFGYSTYRLQTQPARVVQLAGAKSTVRPSKDRAARSCTSRICRSRRPTAPTRSG